MRQTPLGSSHDQRRKRIRSPSPSPERSYHHRIREEKNEKQLEREKLEEDRRKRMARLRAENEEEEKKMAALDSTSSMNQRAKQQSASSVAAANGAVTIKESELEGLDEEEQMRRMLGFSGGFSSTNGQEVEDNQNSAARGAVSKKKARKYRQYMNRKGRFNRPLDKI